MSFRLDLQVGSHDYVLTIWREAVAGASCPVLVRGNRAIVKLPPNRALCEAAREEWLTIAAGIREKSGGAITEVIAGEL